MLRSLEELKDMSINEWEDKTFTYRYHDAKPGTKPYRLGMYLPEDLVDVDVLAKVHMYDYDIGLTVVSVETGEYLMCFHGPSSILSQQLKANGYPSDIDEYTKVLSYVFDQFDKGLYIAYVHEGDTTLDSGHEDFLSVDNCAFAQ